MTEEERKEKIKKLKHAVTLNYSDYVKMGWFWGWDAVNICNTDENVIKELPEELIKSKLFIACPQCSCAPEKLRWINFSTSGKSWENLAGSAGYLSICENCKRQVGYLETMYN